MQQDSEVSEMEEDKKELLHSLHENQIKVTGEIIINKHGLNILVSLSHRCTHHSFICGASAHGGTMPKMWLFASYVLGHGNEQLSIQ